MYEKNNKKSIIVWADDDWKGATKKELIEMVVDGRPKERPCLGIFHFTKKTCYE